MTITKYRRQVSMTVNDLARRVGIAPHVVRYYSQRGLLSPARNARNAYREFGQADLLRLKFICRAKEMGFTLEELSLILRAAEGGVMPNGTITQLVHERAEQNEKRIADAQRLLERVRQAAAKWSSAAGATLSASDIQLLIDAVVKE